VFASDINKGVDCDGLLVFELENYHLPQKRILRLRLHILHVLEALNSAMHGLSPER